MAVFKDGSFVPKMPPHRLGGGIYYRDVNWLARVNLLHAFAQHEFAAFDTPTPGYNLLNAELSYTTRLERQAGLTPEITVGIPSVIQAALLPGLIGWGRTAELLLGGRPIDAVEAERWGLVNRAVADDALDREVRDWVDRLLALPPDALRLQKSLLTRWRRVDLDTAVALSTDVFARAYATGEPSRAMQAFLDRRHAGSRPSGA